MRHQTPNERFQAIQDDSRVCVIDVCGAMTCYSLAYRYRQCHHLLSSFAICSAFFACCISKTTDFSLFILSLFHGICFHTDFIFSHSQIVILFVYCVCGLRFFLFDVFTFKRSSLWLESIINLEISSYFCDQSQCRMSVRVKTEEDGSVNCLGLTNCDTNVIWYGLCIWCDWNANKRRLSTVHVSENHAKSGRTSNFFLEGRVGFFSVCIVFIILIYLAVAFAFTYRKNKVCWFVSIFLSVRPQSKMYAKPKEIWGKFHKFPMISCGPVNLFFRFNGSFRQRNEKKWN